MYQHTSSGNALTLLGHLWLHEPDARVIEQATDQLNLPRVDADELRQAYADLFLLNVPPYGSTFTDERGELNGYSARCASDAFDALGFAPKELLDVGSPDHIGLCLSFFGWRQAGTPERNAEPDELAMFDLGLFEEDFFFWAPSCCIAVEREPFVNEFYSALAQKTREVVCGLAAPIAGSLLDGSLSGDIRTLDLDSGEPLSLNEVVAFFLTPARSGAYLSRSRLGQIGAQLGFRLPFGSRFEVARNLFVSAGEAGEAGAGNLEKLFAMLRAEFDEWRSILRSHERERTLTDASLPMSARAMRTIKVIDQLRKSAESVGFA